MKSLVARFRSAMSASYTGGQFERRFADPGSQGRTIQIDPLAAVDLRLPLQRQAIGVFWDQGIGEGGLGWHAARDDIFDLSPDIRAIANWNFPPLD